MSPNYTISSIKQQLSSIMVGGGMTHRDQHLRKFEKPYHNTGAQEHIRVNTKIRAVTHLESVRGFDTVLFGVQSELYKQFEDSNEEIHEVPITLHVLSDGCKGVYYLTGYITVSVYISYNRKQNQRYAVHKISNMLCYLASLSHVRLLIGEINWIVVTSCRHWISHMEHRNIAGKYDRDKNWFCLLRSHIEHLSYYNKSSNLRHTQISSARTDTKKKLWKVLTPTCTFRSVSLAALHRDPCEHLHHFWVNCRL